MATASLLMNVRQVAEALGVSRRTIYNRLRDPAHAEFPRPCRRVQREHLRWRRAEVEAYIAALPSADVGGASCAHDLV
jgi:predicted DNA-binding transcriptional regulator AlpA